MATFIFALIIFGLCLLGLSISFIVRGIAIKGSCGSAAHIAEASCGGCAKKEAEICPSDDETGLLKMAELGNPNRTAKESDSGPALQV